MCLFSCKSGNKTQDHDKKAIVNSSVLSTDSIISFHFLETAGLDTISYENLIESVRYIPLETKDGSYVDCRTELNLYKVKDKFCVVGGRSSYTCAKLFGEDGKYINEMFKLGRGPEELLSPLEWFADYNSSKMIFVETYGKILVYDINTMKKECYRTPEFDLPEITLLQWCAFEDGTYVGSEDMAYRPQYNENGLPYLYHLDNSFKVDIKKFYPEKREICQTPIQNLNVPYEEWQLSRAYNGVEFIDMYNDTVYDVKSDLSLTPLYIIDRGPKYRPDYVENSKPSRKKDKIYVYNFMDSKDYFFLTYTYGGERRSTVWNKKLNIRYIDVAKDLNNHFRQCSLPFSFDGFSGWLPIEYITEDNKLYVAVEAYKLLHVVPNLKPDDNPVVIEIKLKDNFNSVKQ